MEGGGSGGRAARTRSDHRSTLQSVAAAAAAVAHIEPGTPPSPGRKAARYLSGVLAALAAGQRPPPVSPGRGPPGASVTPLVRMCNTGVDATLEHSSRWAQTESPPAKPLPPRAAPPPTPTPRPARPAGVQMSLPATPAPAPVVVPGWPASWPAEPAARRPRATAPQLRAAPALPPALAFGRRVTGPPSLATAARAAERSRVERGTVAARPAPGPAAPAAPLPPCPPHDDDAALLRDVAALLTAAAAVGGGGAAPLAQPPPELAPPARLARLPVRRRAPVMVCVPRRSRRPAARSRSPSRLRTPPRRVAPSPSPPPRRVLWREVTDTSSTLSPASSATTPWSGGRSSAEDGVALVRTLRLALARGAQAQSQEGRGDTTTGTTATTATTASATPSSEAWSEPSDGGRAVSRSASPPVACPPVAPASPGRQPRAPAPPRPPRLHQENAPPPRRPPGRPRRLAPGAPVLPGREAAQQQRWGAEWGRSGGGVSGERAID